MDITAERIESTVKEEKEGNSLVISPHPKREDIKEHSLLVTLGENLRTARTLVVNIVGEEERSKDISLLMLVNIFHQFGLIYPNEGIFCIFRVDEIVDKHPFPYRNGAVYARPHFVEGVLVSFEMMARNNPDFFVYWDKEKGCTVKDTDTGNAMLCIEDITPENPLFIGADTLVILDLKNDLRIPYTVYGTLEREQWCFFIGTFLAMLFNTTEGYSFINGSSEIEAIDYTDALMSDLNAFDRVRVVINDTDTDGFAELQFTADKILTTAH